MNESYFDNLSDVDLRQELRNYGLPVIPVTETTRNLLIKKLKQHVFGNATVSNKPNRRSLQQSASSRRRNVSSGRRRSYSNSRTNTIGTIQYNSVAETPEKTSTFADQKTFYLSNEGVSYLHKDHDHGNCTVAKSVDGNTNSPPSTRHKSDYATKKCSPKIYLPPPILVNDYSPKRVESPRIPREIERTSLHSGRESSGVVSRLLKLRDISIRGTISSTPSPATKNNLYLSDSDSDSSPTRYSTLQRKYNRSIKDIIWNRLNVKGKFKQSSVPYLLIGCLGLFFVVLAILYMTKPPDMPSTMLEKSTSFTLCEELTQVTSLARPSINCINNDLVAASLTLCKELIQLLQLNTEMHYCKDRETSAEVYGTDFIKYLYKKHSPDGHKLIKGFHAALYLIERNPQWKIQILNKSEGQQLMDIYRQDVRFILLKPYLPWKCILFNKLQRFFFIIGTIFLIAFSLGVAFVIWRFVSQRRIMKLKVVENFCSDIKKELIQMVSLKNDTDGGEVIINHLRDKLVPLSKRKSLLWAWNEAIQKLDSSDSRIQFGTILQNGEEFRTMKWVGSNLSTPSSSAVPNHEKYDSRPQKKHWQSPAFDNVNKILDPPTNCLKIRHMFDTAEANHPDLKESVIESILEKVGPQCHIYDIQLDRQNCCVYIRCASEKDAGIIHNEVNGWWFDNRLVSIKFLRLQRFLTRFPNSTSAITLTIINSK